MAKSQGALCGSPGEAGVPPSGFPRVGIVSAGLVRAAHSGAAQDVQTCAGHGLHARIVLKPHRAVHGGVGGMPLTIFAEL